MKKKYLIAFLIDKKNNWFEDYLSKIVSSKSLNKTYNFKKIYNQLNLSKFDIVFIINFTKIIKENNLKKIKLPIVIHGSKLPDFKGFAPVQNQILINKNKIFFSMIKVANKVDSGDIILGKTLILDGTELYDEIRVKTANHMVHMIKSFLKIYPNYNLTKQMGVGKFYKKRQPKDQKLNFNKSIKENFNLLRTANNKGWPAYFIHKNKKYFLKIFSKK
tara:strand:+ start:176 stop:829 length:654 start_codon:yes stop_codon:yes gene_type:complete